MYPNRYFLDTVAEPYRSFIETAFEHDIVRFSDDVTVIHADGTELEFVYATLVSAEDINSMLVITEHMGYFVFPLTSDLEFIVS